MRSCFAHQYILSNNMSGLAVAHQAALAAAWVQSLQFAYGCNLNLTS
jgi:hypothetical protein